MHYGACQFAMAKIVACWFEAKWTDSTAYNGQMVVQMQKCAHETCSVVLPSWHMQLEPFCRMARMCNTPASYCQCKVD